MQQNFNVVIPFYNLTAAGVAGKSAFLVPGKFAPFRDDFKQFAEHQLGRPVCLCYEGTVGSPILSESYRGKFKRALTICYGAGVDSTIALYWALSKYCYTPEQVQLLVVRYGWMSDKERGTAVDLFGPRPLADPAHGGDMDFAVHEISPTTKHLGTLGVGFVEVGLTPLVPPTIRKAYVIPGRNAVFAAVGSLYSDRVWVVGNYRRVDDGKNAMRDKNRRFYAEVSCLLSQFHGHPVHVESPFQHLSKADAIHWFLGAYGENYGLDILNRTTTCYHPTLHRCGQCAACEKLALTLEELGLLPKFQFTQPPLRGLRPWLRRLKRHWDPSREHGSSR